MAYDKVAKREAARIPRRGVVYFIQAEALGLIKIGSAINADKRLTDLQSGCPDRLRLIGFIATNDIIATEREMHRRFRDHRDHHEWFRPSPEIFDWINEWAVPVIKRKKPHRTQERVRELVMARRAEAARIMREACG